MEHQGTMAQDALRNVIARTFSPDPGFFSPEFKWRQQLLSIVKNATAADRVLLAGSSSHGTSIAGFSDLDYFVVLPGNADFDPASALERLYRTLKMSVSAATEFYIDSPAVCVRNPFTGLVVEFVPAFRSKATGLLIPDLEVEQWIPTDPVAHVAYLNRVGSATVSLRDVIRLLKYWKVGAVPNLSSLYLEMLACQTILVHPNQPLLYQFTECMSTLMSRRLRGLPDPSIAFSRIIQPFTNHSVEQEEVLRLVREARDIALRIDAAEKSVSHSDVIALVASMFRRTSIPEHVLAWRLVRTRRDPIRTNFRNRTRGGNNHGAYAHIPKF